jgi:hypothetical protein
MCCVFTVCVGLIDLICLRELGFLHTAANQECKHIREEERAPVQNKKKGSTPLIRTLDWLVASTHAARTAPASCI